MCKQNSHYKSKDVIVCRIIAGTAIQEVDGQPKGPGEMQLSLEKFVMRIQVLFYSSLFCYSSKLTCIVGINYYRYYYVKLLS